MAGIPEDIIEEIRSRCNIVDVIGGFVQLRRAGGNSYKGLCPFHQEKTPSFFVDSARQSYHCFGCGKGGDVFRFFMDKDNLTFVDAIRTLAGRAGVVIPETSGASPAERDQRTKERERIYQINAELCSLFQKILRDDPNSPVARYLAGRHLTPDVISKFKIGAAPSGWTGGVDYCRGLGFTDDELIAAGVAVRSQKDPKRIFDLFHDRLTFTIENEISRPIGFSARSLEAKPADGRKYVNSPETMIFKKSRTLYALSLARQAMGTRNLAILCEGQMDAIAFHRAGFECAVAPLGSAFTPEQAQILKRYTKNVLLAFDADSAGEKAFLHAAEILLPLAMDVKVMKIAGGKDPDELFNQQGAQGIADAVNSARSWLEVLVDVLKKRYDFANPIGRSEAAAVVAQYLDRVPSEVALELYVKSSAQLLQVSEAAISAELSSQRRNRLRRETWNRPAPEVEKPAPAEKPRPSVALLTLLEIALSSPDAGRMISDEIEPELLAGHDQIHAALNRVIDGSLNNEFDLAVAEVRNSLTESPSPEISRMLIANTQFAQLERAIREAGAELRRNFRTRKLRELTAKLAAAATPQEQLDIMQEIQNLK